MVKKTARQKSLSLRRGGALLQVTFLVRRSIRPSLPAASLSSFVCSPTWRGRAKPIFTSLPARISLSRGSEGGCRAAEKTQRSSSSNASSALILSCADGPLKIGHELVQRSLSLVKKRSKGFIPRVEESLLLLLLPLPLSVWV